MAIVCCPTVEEVTVAVAVPPRQPCCVSPGVCRPSQTTSAYYDLTAYWQALYCATWGSVVLRLWESTGVCVA